MDKLLICAATKMELMALFPDLSRNSIKMGEVYPNKIKGRDVYTQVCGIGPINAALFLERAIVKYKISGVINIGIAGSFDINKIPIGALTIAKQEIWPEFGLKHRDFIDPKGLKYGLIKKHEKIIYNQITISVKKNLEKMDLSFNNNFFKSINLTVAGVTGDEIEANELKNRYLAQVENMEGFSIAYVCFVHDIPFIEIRSISNAVGSRDTDKWDIKKALKELKKIESIF
ncbi:futalosine hydrolase [Desulfothermus naphthae]